MDKKANSDQEPPPVEARPVYQNSKSKRARNLSQIVPVQPLSPEHVHDRSSSLLELPEIVRLSHEEIELSDKSPRRPTIVSEEEYEDSGLSLNSEENAKLKKVLNRIMNNDGNDDEQEQLEDLKTKWVDPTPDLVEGIFYVTQTNLFVRCCSKKRSDKQDKIFVYDQRALYVLHFETWIRKEIVNFACSSMFENFIILLIGLNTIILAIYDYQDRDNLTDWNKNLERIGNVFTVAFTLEMVIKIMAQGFIIHKNAYLKDVWNWLDFVVVTTGIMELMELSWFKVRALRTLRVLRPLRSIKAFPKMRQLVSSLIGSVNSLLNAVIFMLFVFMLFGILGIQQFQGTMYRRCRFSEFPLPDGTWPYDPEIDHLCAPDGIGIMKCPADRYCREPSDGNLGSEIDDPHNQALILYGLAGFDNLAWAMLTIFQMITLEGWTIVMYNLMDSNIWWMGVIFCVCLVIIGSFFLLNVILAVLADALNMVDQVNTRQDQARLTTINRSLDRQMIQKAKKAGKPIPRRATILGDIRVSNLEMQSMKELSSESSQHDQVRNMDKTEKVDSNRSVERVHYPDFEQSALQMSPPHPPKDSLKSMQARASISESKARKSGHIKLQSLQQPSGSENSNNSNQERERENLSDLDKVQPTNPANVNQHLMIDQTPPVITTNSNVGDQSYTEGGVSMISTLSVAPERAYKNKLYLICYKICNHWSFTLFITVLIVANTVVLAMDSYPEDPQVTKVSDMLNEFFTWAFVLEMIIKLIGLGFKEYARDSFNIFDAVIVILSLVDIVVTASAGSNGQSDTLSAFRGVRLLRIFKLARSWSSFRDILAKIIVTLKDVSTFSVLLLMFMFIFTLLGMELFGHNIKFFNNKATEDELFGVSPRPNFDNVGMGFTSVFAIAIGDDWNLLMAFAFRAQGYIALIFYPLVFIMMNLILLNLFLAILLMNFETKEQSNENEKKDIDETVSTKLKRRFQKRCKLYCLRCETKCPCLFLNDSDSEEDSDGSFSDPDGFRTNMVKTITIQDLGQKDDDSDDEDSAFKKQFDIDEDASESKNQQAGQDSLKPTQFQIINEVPSKDEGENSQAEDLQAIIDSKTLKLPFDDNNFEKSTFALDRQIVSERGEQYTRFMSDNIPLQINKQSSVEQHQMSATPRKDSSVESLSLSLVTPRSQTVSPKIDTINTPGNQQDARAPMSPQSNEDGKKSRESEILSPKEGNLNESQLLRKKKTFMKSSKTISKKNFSRMTEDLPEELTKNLMIVMKKEQKSSKKKDNDDLQLKREEELFQSTLLLANSEKNMSLAQLKRQELIEMYGQQEKEIKMVGKSLFFFKPKNWLRRVCFHIVDWKHYDTVVLFLIAISTVLLTLDNPNTDPSGPLAETLDIFDYVLTTLFTLECLINIILFGLIFNGKSSYARDPWNIMDLTIVLFSLLTLILANSAGGDYSILKLFRMLRVLRPLRFLKRNLGLKIQVISLMNAIPDIVNLLLISMLILMIFGIQAVGFLKGKMHYCDTSNVPDYAIEEIQTKWDCYDFGGEWLNHEGNFDDVLVAVITMFGMISTEGWLDVMWNAVDATQVHQVPRRNEQPAFVFFFCFFMIVGSLFILNLFVGVVINTFNIEKEKLSHNNMMTDLQDEYCEVMIKCFQSRPARLVVHTGNRVRDVFLKIANHLAFEIFIFVCICINTVVLALSWYGMSEDIIKVLEILNWCFTAIYSVEMIIKIIAYAKGYFQDSWCVFDFMIVISAWLGIILLNVFSIDVGSISTIIRSFRIARVLKLVKSAKNLQQIFQTFILSIPELVNVGALLVLFLFLFSVLGVSLFAEIKLQDNLDRHANFENFGRASLTLLRVATGEGWVDIMYDTARQPSISFSCVESQTFESKAADGIQGCGSTSAYFFFIAFILVVSYVFLNLFIAIILEGFAGAANEQKIRIDDDAIEAFTKHWSNYDPFATGLIKIGELEDLIMDMIEQELDMKEKLTGNQVAPGFNLHRFIEIELYTKWKRDRISDKEKEKYFKDFSQNSSRQRFLSRKMRQFIANLEIPLYLGFQKVQFHDTLNGFIREIYQYMHSGIVKERQERIKIKSTIGEKLTRLEALELYSTQFFEMPVRDQEEFMELNEEKFQKVINRLENKGNDKEVIIKLNFMRRLRQRTGKNLASFLDQWGGNIFDSSHYQGAQTIKHYMHIKAENKRKMIEQEKSSTEQIIDGEYNSQVVRQRNIRSVRKLKRLKENRSRSNSVESINLVRQNTLQLLDHTSDSKQTDQLDVSIDRSKLQRAEEETKLTDLRDINVTGLNMSQLNDNSSLHNMPTLEAHNFVDGQDQHRTSAPDKSVATIIKLEDEAQIILKTETEPLKESNITETPRLFGDNVTVEEEEAKRGVIQSVPVTLAAISLADRANELRISLPQPLHQEQVSESLVEKTRNQEDHHISDHYASIQRASQELLTSQDEPVVPDVVSLGKESIKEQTEKISQTLKEAMLVISDEDQEENKQQNTIPSAIRVLSEINVQDEEADQKSFSSNPLTKAYNTKEASQLSNVKSHSGLLTGQVPQDLRVDSPQQINSVQRKNTQAVHTKDSQLKVEIPHQASSAIRVSDSVEDENHQISKSGYSALINDQSSNQLVNSAANDLLLQSLMASAPVKKESNTASHPSPAQSPIKSQKQSNLSSIEEAKTMRNNQKFNQPLSYQELPSQRLAFQPTSPAIVESLSPMQFKNVLVDSGEQNLRQSTILVGNDFIDSQPNLLSQYQLTGHLLQQSSDVASPFQQHRLSQDQINNYRQRQNESNSVPEIIPSNYTIQPQTQNGVDEAPNMQIMENQMRKTFIKKQVQDRKGKSVDTYVNRKLRKDVMQTSIFKKNKRDDRSHSINQVSTKKQNVTVFQNSTRKPKPTKVTKTDLIWFSGSQQETPNSNFSSNRQYKNKPVLQKTQTNFNNQKLKTELDQANSSRNGENPRSDDIIPVNQHQTSRLTPNVYSHVDMNNEITMRPAVHMQLSKTTSHYDPLSMLPSRPLTNGSKRLVQQKTTVGLLLDAQGNLSATKLAQLEPNGHALQPQPFMGGIAQLQETLSRGSLATPRQQRATAAQALKSKLVGVQNEPLVPYHQSTQQLQLGQKQRSQSRGGSRQKSSQRRKPFDAYNLI